MKSEVSDALVFALVVILLSSLLVFLAGCAVADESGPEVGDRINAPVGQIIQCLPPIPESQKLACEDKP